MDECRDECMDGWRERGTDGEMMARRRDGKRNLCMHVCMKGACEERDV